MLHLHLGAPEAAAHHGVELLAVTKPALTGRGLRQTLPGGRRDVESLASLDTLHLERAAERRRALEVGVVGVGVVVEPVPRRSGCPGSDIGLAGALLRRGRGSLSRVLTGRERIARRTSKQEHPDRSQGEHEALDAHI